MRIQVAEQAADLIEQYIKTEAPRSVYDVLLLPALAFTAAFGVAGLTLPAAGRPVPCRLVLGALARVVEGAPDIATSAAARRGSTPMRRSTTCTTSTARRSST